MARVVVTTGAVAGPSTPTRTPSSSYFVVGLAERGPTSGVERITSLQDFVDTFGTRPSYGNLYDDVRTFFEEGGTRAFVARVVGPAATTGALASPLQDRAETPVSTMQVTAKGAGQWSSRVKVQVADGSIDDTFTLRILFDDVVVESYVNLRNPQEAVSRTASSHWVVVSDLGSVSVAPDNNPAVVGPVALAAGADDRTNVTAVETVAALARFTDSLGDGAVAIPGGGDAVHAGLIAHANTYYRTAILSSARGTTVDDLVALAASYDEQRAGLFGPWLLIPDGFGGSRAIPPDGYVAGCRARAVESVGPWQAPAGERARFRFVSAVDQVFSDADSTTLDDGKVSAIVGNRLYGWRSLSEDTINWFLLTAADVLNHVTVRARDAVAGDVFGVIDAKGHLLASISGKLEGIVAPIATSNGLYPWIDELTGEMLDPGYKIVSDASNNPRAVAAQNRVYADVGIRPAPSAAMVFLSVTNAGVLARL